MLLPPSCHSQAPLVFIFFRMGAHGVKAHEPTHIPNGSPSARSQTWRPWPYHTSHTCSTIPFIPSTPLLRDANATDSADVTWTRGPKRCAPQHYVEKIGHLFSNFLALRLFAAHNHWMHLIYRRKFPGKFFFAS